MDDLTEEKARQMDAGPELDRVCAEWMLPTVEGRVQHGVPMLIEPRYEVKIGDDVYDPYAPSTDWAAAGPLLEAMRCRFIPLGKDKWMCGYWDHGLRWTEEVARASTPQLAIARACAVLVARGISRDELGGANSK